MSIVCCLAGTVCQQLPVVPNTEHEIIDGQEKAYVEYTCSSGTQHVQGNLVRDCLPTRAWSGTSPLCEGEAEIS